MKILFMGTPSYATAILQRLLEEDEMEVVSLITQPDKPVGRKQVLTPPDTKKYCLEEGIGIDIFQPDTLRRAESIDYIRSHNPDFIVVAAFGQILPREVLEIAPCINLHASLLPKYRGASPIQAAILEQEKYSGVTSMLMDIGLDTGDILGYSVTNIEDMDAAALFVKLSHMAADLCVKTLHHFHEITPLPQLDCDSSYAGKITKADGKISFTDARQVYAKYLAFIFWPGIYLESGLKLKKVALADDTGRHHEGEILEVGKTAAVSLFGDNISRYFAAAIAIGILSAVSAMIMTGPRVYYAMSKDGVFFKLFGKIDSIHKTPGYSIFLQAALAIIMVVTSAFDKLLLYIGFTLAVFAMLTVAGMIALRIKKPSLERRYKTFGYPFTPFFFILGNLWIIFFSIKEKPVVSLFGLGTIGLGGLIYLYFKKSGGAIRTGIHVGRNRMKIIAVCREVIEKTGRK